MPDVINIVDQDERSGDPTDDDTKAAMPGIDEQNEMVEHGDSFDSGTRTKEAKFVNKSKGVPPITELPVFYKPPVHDYQIMAMAFLWIIVFSVIGFGDSISSDGKELIVGSVTNFCLVFFYGAPLSSIAIVLKTRNTATLHVPTMFTNTASSVFWGVYGLAVMDFFVMVPNLIGAVLGVAQIVLYLIYPRVETTTIPVITAAVPLTGGGIDADSTEMEVVQLQMHDLSTPDLLNNTGINETSNNPLAVEYTIPTDENGNVDPNVTTLHKREISMDGIMGVLEPNMQNPLVLQYASPSDTGMVPSEYGSTMVAPEGSSPSPTRADNGGESLSAGVGLLHRRTSSRDANGSNRQLVENSENNILTPASVASVHHRRVLSSTNDNSFSLAGIFGSDPGNVTTTTTATLHRRVSSRNVNLHQE